MSRVAVAVIAALAEIVLVGRAWEACDVGVNAVANEMTLILFVLPALLVAHAAAFAVWALVVRRAAKVGSSARLLTAAGTIAVTVGLAVVVAVVVATPAGQPSPQCDENVPPWWPSWVPS